MGGEKKLDELWSKTIRSGGYVVEISEIANGRDKGKFQIAGTLNGKWNRFGVRTTQEKAIEVAEKLVEKEDLSRTRINTLNDAEVALVIQFLDSGMTADDLKAFVMKTKHTKASSLAEVLDEWYETQTERHEYSADYLTDWKYVVKNLKEDLSPQRQFNTIDTEDLEDWLDGLRNIKTKKVLGAKRHKNLRGILVTIWKWAAVRKRSYASENWASAIEVRRELARSGGHEVLLPTEFSLLLERVETPFIPWFTISGFAGLPQSEICGTRGRREDRLKWQDLTGRTSASRCDQKPPRHDSTATLQYAMLSLSG
ncbi:MAG: hypothetical protein ABGY95_09905 [Rubritalea sp.]|uniref:hypothetical protein n=1 Tax=Rubritalea sp. TaxID=2109375 RepID=UPI00324292C4